MTANGGVMKKISVRHKIGFSVRMEDLEEEGDDPSDQPLLDQPLLDEENMALGYWRPRRSIMDDWIKERVIVRAEKRRRRMRRLEFVLQLMNIALPHIVLTSILLVYLVLGALILILFESGYDKGLRLRKMTQLSQTYDQIANDTWKIFGQLSEQEWDRLIRAQMMRLGEIHEAGIEHKFQVLPYVASKWTFPTALLNTLTLVAACGYNEVTSYTPGGQMFAVAYTMIGIPLMFVTAANIGKVLSEVVVYVVEMAKKIYIHVQRMRHLFRRRFLPPKRTDCVDPAFGDTESHMVVEIPEQPESIWFAIFIYIAGISAYCGLGTLMFRSWKHEWSFVHAFHFGFNLIVTVGLGDILVADYLFLTLIVAFTVTGLAVVTMCIDLASEHLKEFFNSIHYYGRSHKLTLDQDVIQMVEFLSWMRAKKGGTVTWQEVRDMMESIRRGAYNPREAVRWHWVDTPRQFVISRSRQPKLWQPTMMPPPDRPAPPPPPMLLPPELPVDDKVSTASFCLPPPPAPPPEPKDKQRFIDDSSSNSSAGTSSGSRRSFNTAPRKPTVMEEVEPTYLAD